MGWSAEASYNAMYDSFFATRECKLLERQRFRAAADARREAFSFTKGFYDTRRLHSAIAYQALANFAELNRAA